MGRKGERDVEGAEDAAAQSTREKNREGGPPGILDVQKAVLRPPLDHAVLQEPTDLGSREHLHARGRFACPGLKHLLDVVTQLERLALLPAELIDELLEQIDVLSPGTVLLMLPRLLLGVAVCVCGSCRLGRLILLFLFLLRSLHGGSGGRGDNPALLSLGLLPAQCTGAQNYLRDTGAGEVEGTNGPGTGRGS